MARKPARRPARRTAPARRSYSSSSRSRVRSPARRSTGVRRASSGRQNVLKIVVETVAATPIARPEGIPQVETGKTKKSRF